MEEKNTTATRQRMTDDMNIRVLYEKSQIKRGPIPTFLLNP